MKASAWLWKPVNTGIRLLLSFSIKCRIHKVGTACRLGKCVKRAVISTGDKMKTLPVHFCSGFSVRLLSVPFSLQFTPTLRTHPAREQNGGNVKLQDEEVAEMAGKFRSY